MRKVLSLVLVFAAVVFAAQTNMEGDVLLASPNEALAMTAVASELGFDVGTKGSTEIMRDMWAGSDFDQDGKMEIILASYAVGGKAYVYEITGNNTAELFFETADLGGSYTSACRDAKFGDLDGNGMQELLVSINSIGGSGGIWVYEYDTVGDTMRTPVKLFGDIATANRWYVENFYVEDVDGDGIEELMVGNNGSTNDYDEFMIYSVTSGTFAAGDYVWTEEFKHERTDATFPLGGSPYGPQTADLDGDGKTEVIFSAWDHGALLIVEADSANSYTTHNYIQTDLTRADDFAFYFFPSADLDEDGREELYLSMYSGGSLYAITCPSGTELSTMTTADVHILGVDGSSGGVSTQMGDWDNNGKPNIYASGGGSYITVHEYQGGDPADSANWVALPSLTGESFSGVFGISCAGDYDKDGYVEIYGANTGSSTVAASAIEGVYDITETFDTDANVGIWVSANSGWTSRIWEDSTLLLSDAGWTIDGRRPIHATPGTFFKATAKIKTGSFDTSPSQYLNFGVEGIAAETMQVGCISEDVFTTFYVIGLAENAEGTLFINGQGAAGRDSVWIDEYTFEDDYMPGLTSISSVADARLIADGSLVATKGIVTVSTQFGYAGPAYIQDETAGIAVYGATVAQNVSDGDEILVVGEIDIYNGLVEVAGNPDVIVLSTGNTVEPVEVTFNDFKDAESYEGQLVVVKGCDTLATGLDWAATAGSNKGFNLKDKNDSTFYCYIDKDTDIDGSPKPLVWPINITGIIGDYRGAQLLPRSLADWNPNTAPGPFMLLNPADGITISSLGDAALVDMPMGEGGDSVKTLFINWTEAVDNDALDTVTYKMMFVGDGPDDEMATKDTFMYIPINEEKPYEMNGVYTYYFEASDLSGEISLSDTHTITFDFPAPPQMMYADLTLLDGVPTWYAQFDLPLDAPVVDDFKVLDINAPAVVTPTAVTVVAPNAVMVAAPMNEDGYYALVASGLTTTGADVSVTDTSKVLKAYIPFSAAHPEDAEKQIESFNTGTGLFWDPNGSGSTRGVLDASALTIQDSMVYNGAAAAALTLLDDPAVDGGWYVRLYHTLSHSVKTTSEILLMVKGVGDVDMRLSLKDTGYEQGPWKHVSLCEDDWQVVSFDLVNDEAEGWITGNGVVEGETMLVEAIHIKSAADEDVVLFMDGFTERQVLEPVNITLNVIMKKQVADAAFNLATDFVDVAGTFNGWGGTSMVLDDFDGDTTYSIVVPLMPYSSHDFKFRINGSWNDATAEFPYGGPARHISVRDYDRSYTYWYNDDTLIVVPGVDGIPAEFALHQNYPNPFNPVTSINFDLPEVADVKLVIYDITGRKVRTLVNESALSPGYMKINWNGRDDYGNSVSTGMYIYRLQAGDFVDVKKMTFLK